MNHMYKSPIVEGTRVLALILINKILYHDLFSGGRDRGKGKGDFGDESIVLFRHLYQHWKRSLSGGCGKYRRGSSNLSGIRKQSNGFLSLGLQLPRETNFML